ncbi:sigma-70 family RNA polymerase sigma factor [Catenulispora pinisilvae]|uniref:sigma-70 family RNA polymerase sigma factor n=1 Tax=Catenulispora pinisilvae TaxID=2705253 RepID=UPI001891F411|nr:sigma-70 family RNA polymerase sigma factor [Catenulispora pinisilvae]
MGRYTVSPSALDLAAESFNTLCASSVALSLDTTGLSPDLPAAAVPVNELQRLLLAGASQAARDAVWAEVIRRARHDKTWLLAAAGMALPALRNVAAGLAHGFDGEVEELDAEILAGFLAHVVVVDVESPGIMTKLRWAAYRAGHAFVVAHRRTAEHEEEISEKTCVLSPAGHPDLVLMRAVAAGAISESDAELISATRLGRVDMEDYAAQLGVSYNAVKIRRQRAEARLVAFVTGTQRPRAHEARVRAIQAAQRPIQRPALSRSAELSPAA